MAANAETPSRRRHFSSVTALAFRPDGEILAVAYINISEDKASDIDFLDVRSPTLTRHFLAHCGIIHAIAFSPDGAWLVSVRSHQAIGVGD